jgi:hypothetical protein
MVELVHKTPYNYIYIMWSRQKETDQAAQGHVKNRSECSSPNRNRQSTSLIESNGMGAMTNTKRQGYS